MKTGAEVDIFSGRPVMENRAEKKLTKENADKASLKKKAEFLEIIQGDAGGQVVEVIEGLLIDRLTVLAVHDPEAIAYHKILKSLGYKANTAERAVEELYMKHLKVKKD